MFILAFTLVSGCVSCHQRYFFIYKILTFSTLHKVAYFNDMKRVSFQKQDQKQISFFSSSSSLFDQV